MNLNSPLYRLNSLYIVLGIFAIIPFLVLNLFNNPSMDDFTFASRDLSKDFLTAQFDLYMNWSGRYFGTASSRINPIINQNFTAYKVYSFVVILVYLSAIIFFFHSLLRQSFSLRSILAISSLVITILIITMPDIAQGLYWFSGYITYLGAMIYFLVLLGILLRLPHIVSSTSEYILKVLSFVLVFAISGSNELSMIILNASLLLMVITSYYTNKRLPVFYTSLFLFALVLGLLVVLAPGNYARMDSQSNSGNLFFSASAAILMVFVSFMKWGFIVLTFSVIYILTWAKPIYNSAKLKKLFGASIPLTIVWYLATMFLMQFLFLYATGFRASTRVENVIHFFFIFGWIYLLQLLFNRYGQNTSSSTASNTPLISVLLAATVWIQTFSLDSNVTTAYLDILSGRAASFDKELNDRYQYLQTSDCNSCPIKPVEALPKSLYLFSTLRPDELAEMGINDDYSIYWGKEEIYLTGPTPAIPDNLTTLKMVGENIKSKVFSDK